MPKNILRIFVIFALTLSLSACASKEEEIPPVEELYATATEAMQEKNYSKAAEFYAQIQSNYPFSSYAIEAELSLGDALFLDRKYLEAADAYKNFDELHPRNESTPYVLYQIGMSLKSVNTSVDRTAKESEEAILFFQRLVDSFPENVYAEQAITEIERCKIIIAERELYIAKVFWHMGNKGAAYKRYKYVYEKFPELPDIAAYAKHQAEASYLEHVEITSELHRRKLEGSWHDYFKWL